MGFQANIRAAEKNSPFFNEALFSEFYRLRISSGDLTLPTSWPRPYTLKIIDQFFKTPLIVPDTTNDYLNKIDAASSLTDIFNLSQDILSTKSFSSKTIEKMPSPSQIQFPEKSQINSDLKLAITNLYNAIHQATPFIKKSSDSVSFEDKQNFLSLNEWPNPKSGVIKEELSTRRIKAQYAAMKTFDEKSLYDATRIIFLAIDQNLPTIESASFLNKSFKTIKLKTSLGWVLIKDSQNDIYKEKDLENVVLLIDLGGNNAYETSVAYASDGQIRIVLDFGKNLQIKSETIPSAGSGIFGIGVFIAPNGSGEKLIQSGTHSLGCGLGGTGVFINNGPGNFSGNVYSEGVGSFGLGLFKSTLSNSSTFYVNRMGQGLGYVKGVGLFSLKGDNNHVSGGLTDPDPREPKGAISLCQGVGYGHRSYVGGGVGLASILGDQNIISSSYFSQGVGYWKSLGGFRLIGNKNQLTARRYDQGSGVHYAFGYFQMLGNENHLSNWGVGPAHAWDHSFASSLIEGNDNLIQTEWGAGSAQIGSLSFPIIRGNNNRLLQTGLGDAPFFRGEFSYNVSIVEGEKNVLKLPEYLPFKDKNLYTISQIWGIVKLSGTTIDPNLELPKQEWPDIQQDEIRAREKTNLSAQIEESTIKPTKEKISDLLEVAAAFSLDKESPKKALKKLLSLSPEEVSDLVGVLDPISVEQMVVLQVILPTYGEEMVEAIKKNFDSSDAEKKATLINLMGKARASKTLEFLNQFIQKPTLTEDEKRIRLIAIRTLAQLQNKDKGIEPGMRASLEEILSSLHSPFSGKKKKGLAELLLRIKLCDQLALYSMSTDLSPIDRQKIGEFFPDDLTTELNKEGVEYLIKKFHEKRKTNIEKIQTQLTALTQNENQTRNELTILLKSTRTNELSFAISGLGQIQNPNDLEKITPFLNHSNGLIREITSLNLGRFGEIAIPFLKESLSSKNSIIRRQAMAALPHSTSDQALPLLFKALSDQEKDIRLSAACIIKNLPAAFTSQLPSIRKYVRKRISEESDPSIKRLLILLHL